MKVAFYAPVKPPDHHIPSGDRLIGQNLVKALETGGASVEIASRFIAYSKRESNDILIEKKRAALEEADNVLERISKDPPDLFLTYHPYCKAPDWIGPHVASALQIPYVTIEAAHTGQGFENGGDRWKNWRHEAQTEFSKADLHLCFKPTDKDYLLQALGPQAPVDDLPIFIDAAENKENLSISHPSHWRPNVPVVFTAAMMRPGKKTENFKIISQALKPLQALNWNLIVAGSGPEEKKVREFFSKFSQDRILFAGGLEHDAVLAHLSKADVFFWPGWKEPIGMVYLEAQTQGVPVIASKSMGVPLVVKHGISGLLSPEGDTKALTENLAALLSHPVLRRDLAKSAKNYVQTHHSLKAASKVLLKKLRKVAASHNQKL
jgi:glycosyltransferase involved in cell wall biosynthesis